MGTNQGDGITAKKEKEAVFTEICLFLTRVCARLLQHPTAHPVLQGSHGPHTLCEGQENPHGSGEFWGQELLRPRLGRGLWQTPANGSWSHTSVRKSTSSRSTSQIHGETDRQTGRPRRARPGGRVSGWAGGGRHAAKPLGGRSGERRQVPPHGAEAPGSASAALTVRAPALRRGGGDVPGGQGREMGQLGGLGCRAPSSLH